MRDDVIEAPFPTIILADRVGAYETGSFAGLCLVVGEAEPVDAVIRAPVDLGVPLT